MDATPNQPVVFLSGLLKQPVLDPGGRQLGRLSDVIVALRSGDYPLVTGVVVHVGGDDVFVPAGRIAGFGPDRTVLSDGAIERGMFDRREGEVLLRADVLGHRVLDVARARLMRGYDVALTEAGDGTWVAAGLDAHRAALLHLPGRHPSHRPRDWKGFEPLIGHQPSAHLRTPFGRLRRLKAAQIADLLESADQHEQREILTQVHDDPELEADVFEELDDDQQSRLLSSRTDADIAAVLDRMRADDAADALFDLPQERRRSVLEALLPEQRRKVTTLLGYNEATAGGLMGVDYVALPPEATAAEALDRVRRARTNPPEALLTVYLSDADGRLAGSVGLVAALQADPETTLQELADLNPVCLPPEADIPEVITRMADFNLLTLPIVDRDRRLLGLVTADDILEAVIPRNWRRRESPPAAGPASEPAAG